MSYWAFGWLKVKERFNIDLLCAWRLGLGTEGFEQDVLFCAQIYPKRLRVCLLKFFNFPEICHLCKTRALAFASPQFYPLLDRLLKFWLARKSEASTSNLCCVHWTNLLEHTRYETTFGNPHKFYRRLLNCLVWSKDTRAISGYLWWPSIGVGPRWPVFVEVNFV